MNPSNYLKQADAPLFPNVLWQRPVSRNAAGRLLLIGGHRGDFSLIQAIYQTATASGIGQCTVVLPDSLKPLLAGVPDIYFVPSSPSGSLGPGALGEILHLAGEYDAIAVGANLSSNSQTSILVESLLSKLDRPIIAFGDGLASMGHNYHLLIDNPHSLVVATMPELFKIAGGIGLPLRLKTDGGVVAKVEVISKIKSHSQADILLIGRDMIAASSDKISLTSAVSAMDFFTAASIAVAAVFWLQQPSNRFAGLTTAAFVLSQIRQLLYKDSSNVLTTNEITTAIRQALREQT